MNKVHNLKKFQVDAVEAVGEELAKALNDNTFRRSHKVVLHSPTGSGKTRMIAEIIKDYLAEALVLVLSPGKGNLHEQTLESLSHSLSNEAHVTVKGMSLENFRLEPEPGTVFVANWERLTTQKDGEYTVHLTRKSETDNLFDHIRKGVKKEIPVVVIIDEAHYGATANAKRIQGFLKDISDTVKDAGGQDIVTFEASATPLDIIGKTSRRTYEVTVDEVVDAGLNRVAGVWNADLDNKTLVEEEQKAQELQKDKPAEIQKTSTAVYADVEELLLDKANERRKRLNALMKAEGSDYRILLAIQIPNSNLGVEAQTRTLDYFERQGITIENKRLAIITSSTKAGEVEGLSSPDSPVDVLIYKQALDTGWNCPRAQILVGFRHIKSQIFSLQNIGRFRRTTEAFHYNNHELNKFYVYANTTNSLQEYITEQKGVRIGSDQFERNHMADTDKLELMNGYKLPASRWQRVNQNPIPSKTLKNVLEAVVEEDPSLTDIAVGKTAKIHLRTGEYNAEDFSSEEALKAAEHKGSLVYTDVKASGTRQQAIFADIVKDAVILTGDYGNNQKVTNALIVNILDYYRKVTWKNGDKYITNEETVDSFLSSPAHRDILQRLIETIMGTDEVQAYTTSEDTDGEVVPVTNRVLTVVGEYEFAPSLFIKEDPSKNAPARFSESSLYGAKTNSGERYAQWQESLSTPETLFQNHLMDFLAHNPDYQLEVIHKNAPYGNGKNFSLGMKIRVKDKDGKDSVTNFFPDYLLVLRNKSTGTSFPVIVEVKDPKNAGRNQDTHIRNKARAAETYMQETGIPFYLVGSGDLHSTVLDRNANNTTQEIFNVLKEKLDNGTNITEARVPSDNTWMNDLGYIED